MVAAVRSGQSSRAVARQSGAGVATAAMWGKRAKGQRPHRVDWPDRPSAPQTTRRTEGSVGDLVLSPRRESARGDLGAVVAAE